MDEDKWKLAEQGVQTLQGMLESADELIKTVRTLEQSVAALSGSLEKVYLMLRPEGELLNDPEDSDDLLTRIRKVCRDGLGSDHLLIRSAEAIDKSYEMFNHIDVKRGEFITRDNGDWELVVTGEMDGYSSATINLFAKGTRRVIQKICVPKARRKCIE